MRQLRALADEAPDVALAATATVVLTRSWSGADAERGPRRRLIVHLDQERSRTVHAWEPHDVRQARSVLDLRDLQRSAQA